MINSKEYIIKYYYKVDIHVSSAYYIFDGCSGPVMYWEWLDKIIDELKYNMPCL